MSMGNVRLNNHSVQPLSVLPSFSLTPIENKQTEKVSKRLFKVIQTFFLNPPDSLENNHIMAQINQTEKGWLNKFITPIVGFVKKSLHLPLSNEELVKKVESFVKNLEIKNKGGISLTPIQIHSLALSVIKTVSEEDFGNKTLKGRITPPAGPTFNF